jgi:HK97 family phage portal protein
MSAWGRVLSALGIVNQTGWASDIPPAASAQLAAGSDFYRLVSGMEGELAYPNERTALTISSVYACVNLIAGAIASLPMNIYRRSPDGARERLANDDLWWLLNEQFSPRWSAASGWEFLCQSLLLQGDGFAAIRRAGARISALEPINPKRVTVLVNPETNRLLYAVAADPYVPGSSGLEVFEQDDMLHVAGFGFDGVRGLSPLQHHLRMTGAVALATQKYAGKYFANSARPDIVISTDQVINAETAEQIAERWRERYAGADNAGKPAVLGSGTKVEPLSITAEDAQLIAARQFQVEEIARIYGVPPFMIGHNEKTTSWGSGVEAMGIGFVRYTLRQHLNKFHNEINRKFFVNGPKFAEFDTFELERGDFKTMIEGYRTALGRAGERPIMKLNEVREKFNLPPDANGNSLDPVGSANEQAAQPPGA